MKSQQLALTAAFTALAIASDFALADFPNVKVVDPMVFSVAFVFGLETGLCVGVLSEVIWGTVSPYGFGGYIIPFLVAGECIYALAGFAAAKVWAGDGAKGTRRNLYFGGLMALCAFAWDLETNLGTAILSFWPSLTLKDLLVTEAAGIPFMVPHELTDLVGGAILAPFIIFYASRLARPRLLTVEARP